MQRDDLRVAYGGTFNASGLGELRVQKGTGHDERLFETLHLLSPARYHLQSISRQHDIHLPLAHHICAFFRCR